MGAIISNESTSAEAERLLYCRDIENLTLCIEMESSDMALGIRIGHRGKYQPIIGASKNKRHRDLHRKYCLDESAW